MLKLGDGRLFLVLHPSLHRLTHLGGPGPRFGSFFPGLLSPEGNERVVMIVVPWLVRRLVGWLVVGSSSIRTILQGLLLFESNALTRGKGELVEVRQETIDLLAPVVVGFVAERCHGWWLLVE